MDKTAMSQFIPLVLLTAIFFLNFTIRIIISPLLPTILSDMNLTASQAGSFFLISATGYSISLLCSGFVSSQIRHKKTIVFSAITSGIAFLSVGLSQNLMSMQIGLFVVGMVTGLYLPSGIAMLTAAISSRNWGKAIGVHEMAPNLSFLLVPIFCEGLLLWLSWRSVLIVVGSTSILLGISFFKFFSGKDFPGEAPVLKSFLPIITLPSFWMMIILFSLGVTGGLGVYSLLPLFLFNEHGMLQSQANTLITLSRILALPMAIVIGWVSDRFGAKPTLSFVLLFSGMSTLLIGVESGRLLQIIIFCQAVFSVCFFPPAFAALSSIGSKETRNVVISFTIPAAFWLGGGVAPKVMGFLGEKGFFPVGFIISGGVILLGAGIPFFLKFQEHD